MENKDCSQHKKEVAGISDMKVLAEMIGDFHYEILNELFKQLWIKIGNDANKDIKGGRILLGLKLKEIEVKIFSAQQDIQQAWQISKPFMEDKPNS